MGCTRSYTEKDHHEIRASVPKGVDEKIGKKRRDKIRERLDATASKTLINILRDPHHRAYQSVAALLAKSVGGKMTEQQAMQLPKAFHVILKEHPNAMGLFKAATKERAPGMSAVSHHYEISAIAALKQKKYKSGRGKSLDIVASDRLDFGMKFASGYAQPKRYGTIEADALISRGKNLFEEKTIAVDAKYSKTAEYPVIDALDLKRQLDGIRVGFRDGKIDEFYFATNGLFSKDFHEMVEKENLAIARDYAERTYRIYNGVDKNNIHPDEKPHIPEGKLPKDFFTEKNREQVEEFIKKYDVPQIDTLQYVQFEQT